MGHVILYRAGKIELPTNRGVEKQSYINADAIRPSHIKYGRNDSIFATYRIIDASWWVKGVSKTVSDARVRELIVDPRDLYAFSVVAWGKASNRDEYTRNDDREYLEYVYKDYWETGVPLSDLVNNPSKFPFFDAEDIKGWEVLLPVSHVKKERILPKEEVEQGIEGYSKYLFNEIKKHL